MDINEIDIIVVYSPITDKVYWFEKPQWLGKTHLVIRYEQSRNNQLKGCLEAKVFEW